MAADLDTCKLRGRDRVIDKLETVLISGSGAPPLCVNEPTCCIVPRYKELHVAQRGSTEKLWARSVFFDQLNLPNPDVAVSVSVVDTNGREVPDQSGEFALGRDKFTTGADGFGPGDLSLAFTDAALIGEIYLVRLSWYDRSVTSFSYGAYYYLTDDRGLSENDVDRLLLQGFQVVN